MKAKIISKKFLNPEHSLFEMVVDSSKIAKKAHAGNFVILRINETGERIPLTIADWDREKGTITIVVMAVGKSTTQLSKLNVGEEILNFIGPLGNHIHIKRHVDPVVIMGGGFGIAPCYPQAKEMKEAGNHVFAILSARTKSLIFWEDKFREFCDEVYITTDDGSYGMKGFGIDKLKELMQQRPLSHVIAIGPLIMMKFVALLTNGKKKLPFVPTTVSLNPLMIDGTGMCGGCRFQTLHGETKFACVDGPDVDGHDVDFDNLLKRNNRFVKVEKARLEKYNEQCKALENNCEE